MIFLQCQNITINFILDFIVLVSLTQFVRS